MKAAVIEQAGHLTIRDLPAPEPGPYEARYELLYGSVCGGTDTHLFHFRPPFCHWVKLPFILGHESVGRVVELGKKVRNYRSCDVIARVGCPATGGVGSGWGGFAEVGIATDWRAMMEDGVDGGKAASLTAQQILPPDVDPAVGTLFITWRETLSYITRMGVRANASVLIVGTERCLKPGCDVKVSLRLNRAVKRATLEPQGVPVPFAMNDGRIEFEIDRFTCHQMVAFD